MRNKLGAKTNGIMQPDLDVQFVYFLYVPDPRYGLFVFSKIRKSPASKPEFPKLLTQASVVSL